MHLIFINRVISPSFVIIIVLIYEIARKTFLRRLLFLNLTNVDKKIYIKDSN